MTSLVSSRSFSIDIACTSRSSPFSGSIRPTESTTLDSRMPSDRLASSRGMGRNRSRSTPAGIVRTARGETPYRRDRSSFSWSVETTTALARSITRDSVRTRSSDSSSPARACSFFLASVWNVVTWGTPQDSARDSAAWPESQ